MNDAKAIRKHTAQHDLFNRLHSISADGAFVKKVAEEWYDGRFEVVPNQRCGTWYCDPSSSSTAYAYFKSTDGHTNNWNFNLRRSNLAFAQLAEAQGGLILVDSTRRGKRMPDALSKTVPIWCAVINIALQLRREDDEDSDDDNEEDVTKPSNAVSWDATLYLPPNIVSPSEKAQIQALLPGWAAALETSALPLPSLSKPLRPFFIHPGTSSPPQIPQDPPYTPIICASASRWVGAGGDDTPSVTNIGRRTVGFEYVPGAGDDDELWARGLKPALYHSRRAELLQADRDELPNLVDQLVQDSKDSNDLSLDGLTISETHSTSHIIGVPGPTSTIATDLGPPTISQLPWENESPSRLYIVEVDRPANYPTGLIPFGEGKTDSILAVPNPRADGKAYHRVLADLTSALKASSGVCLLPARKADLDAAIKASSAKTSDGVGSIAPNLSTTTQPLSPAELVSARKVILPLLVCLSCAFSHPDTGENGQDAMIDKSVIADQLHRVVSLWPDGNPPRAALKRVNEVLMSRGRV